MGSDRIDFVLPARAENVQVVRHAIAGLAETLGMEPQAIADLKSVVTEACTNVVAHAYDDGPGPLEVSAWPEGRRLVVRVRDSGEGIRLRLDPARPSLRLGLPLIAALTESFELDASPGGGTDVTMRIPFAAVSSGARLAVAPPSAEETAIELPAGVLLAPVLSRVISMFAVRADFSLDKLSDALLLGDAVSINPPSDYLRATVRITVSEVDDGFALTLGPFVPGAGRRLLAGIRIEAFGVSLERLAEELRVISNGEGGGEQVMLRFSRQHVGAPAANGD